MDETDTGTDLTATEIEEALEAGEVVAKGYGLTTKIDGDRLLLGEQMSKRWRKVGYVEINSMDGEVEANASAIRSTVNKIAEAVETAIMAVIAERE